ncbi:MAG TPA: MDR family MFS transporter [Roseiflexaceae bacterium]|nr:MDR family MFS transporter [Roseiflexaceae bacterium]
MASTTYTGGERIDYAAILPSRTKFIILAGVLLCLFLAALDQTIVGTALPAIVRDFNGLDLVAWISTGYLLASTTMVPIYGKLSDLYGRKVILVWGIVSFLAGSMLCGIANSMIQLIAFRVIQGIGAAALTSTAFAVPADLFAPAERARYMGMFGGVFGLSSVIGPFLGGLLTDQFSWHWIFYVNLPLGILALAFVLLKMPALKSGLRAPIDWVGTILLVVSVVPLLLGLTLDKTLYPWSSPLIVSLLTVATIGTLTFLFAETRAPSPIIELSLFRNRTFAVVILASVLNGSAFFGAILFLSLYLVNVVGMSATQAGTAQIPLMLAFVGSSIVASNMVQRVGRYKPFIVGGFLVMLVGFFFMSQLSVDSTMLDVTWRMVLLGLGIGPAMPLLNLAMQNDIPFNVMGSATANRQFFQQLGQAIGAAIFGVILSTTLTAQITANLQPVISELPAAVQAQYDASKMRQNVASEGGGEQASIDERINAQVKQQFDSQRALLTAALRDNDAQAIATLKADPRMPDQLKQLLGNSAVPAAAREQALTAALGQLDTAEQQALADAQTLAGKITRALKLSFTNSITRIYSYAIWLVLGAFLLVAFLLPEKPLRTTNRTEAPAVVME